MNKEELYDLCEKKALNLYESYHALGFQDDDIDQSIFKRLSLIKIELDRDPTLSRFEVRHMVSDVFKI